jgi:predicted dienelactone hydrolase
MELARRGFVVAAPAHPGNTQAEFPECASVATTIDTALNRVPDVRFIIDSLLAETDDPSSPLARRIRPESIAVAGLSFGGFTTLLAAQQEPRLRAALALVPGGTAVLGPNDITIPTMVIGAERDVVVTYAESERAYARLAGPRFLVKLFAANHLSVVDDCFDQNLGIDLCVPNDISQDEAHRLVLRYALPFMKRYLANQKAAARKIRRPDPGVELTLEPTPPLGEGADATP